MELKNNIEEENLMENGRFTFVLTANDYVVCRRNFIIQNFQEKSLDSVNLVEAIQDCARMIDDDMREKTKLYMEITAPQVFKDKDEMDWWVKTRKFKLDVPSFVLLKNAEEGKHAYVWDGEKMKPYNKPFINDNDYIGDNSDAQCILKFSFYVDNIEQRYMIWDASRYPRFIRTNIDLTNRKNKYKDQDNGVFAPFEAAVIDVINANRDNLITKIFRRLTYACTGENLMFFNKLRYGDKRYNVSRSAYRINTETEGEN